MANDEWYAIMVAEMAINEYLKNPWGEFPHWVHWEWPNSAVYFWAPDL